LQNVHRSIETRIDRISSSREVKKEIVMPIVRFQRFDRDIWSINWQRELLEMMVVIILLTKS